MLHVNLLRLCWKCSTDIFIGYKRNKGSHPGGRGNYHLLTRTTKPNVMARQSNDDCSQSCCQGT
jgi:hypothetical protein